MQLTLDNLDEIHDRLTVFYDEAMAVFINIDFHADILPSPENRQLLNELFEKTGGYLLEVCHVISFLQKLDVSEVMLTAHQQKSIMDCKGLCKKLKDFSNQTIKWVVYPFNLKLSVLVFENYR